MEQKQTRYCNSCRSALSANSPSHHYLCRSCFARIFRSRGSRRKVVLEPSKTFDIPDVREKAVLAENKCESCLVPISEDYVQRGFKYCYPCWRKKLNNDSRMAVTRAIEEGGSVRIKYWSRSSGTSIREVEPESIYLGYNGSEYFDGFCLSRGANRTFRIDRIGELLEPAVRPDRPTEKRSDETGDAGVSGEITTPGVDGGLNPSGVTGKAASLRDEAEKLRDRIRGVNEGATIDDRLREREEINREIESLRNRYSTTGVKNRPTTVHSPVRYTEPSHFGIQHFTALLVAGLMIIYLLL